MDRLDVDDPRPPYQQIAERLRAAIEAQEFGPGQQLPSHKGLADEYGVAEGTVKRALALLREQGLIVTRHGMGSYVRNHPTNEDGLSADDALTRVQREVAELSRRLDEVERRLSRKK